MPIQKERLLQQLKVHRKGQNIKLAKEYTPVSKGYLYKRGSSYITDILSGISYEIVFNCIPDRVQKLGQCPFHLRGIQ